MNNYYDLCCRYHGKHVTIKCRDGKIHNGKIVRVTRRNVYIQPIRPNQLGGFGYGYYGYYRPYAVPLAFIAGVAIGSLFFW